MGGSAQNQDQSVAQPEVLFLKRTSKTITSNAHHFPTQMRKLRPRQETRFIQALSPRVSALPMATLAEQERDQEPVARGHLTILAVVEDVHFALLSPQQGLRQAGHGTAWGVGAGEEVTGARSLHHLHSGVAKEFTEAIVAVNDGAVLHLSIGDQELSTWGGRGEGGSPWQPELGGREGKIIGTLGSSGGGVGGYLDGGAEQ